MEKGKQTKLSTKLKIMRTKLLLMLLCVMAVSTTQAQDKTPIENTWIIQKITTPKGETSYVDWKKSYSIKITDHELIVRGSCIPGVCKSISTDDGAIKYNEKTTWNPGCCFFDNPNEELMKMPEFDGDYKLKGDKLTIYHGDTVYYFMAKK